MNAPAIMPRQLFSLFSSLSISRWSLTRTLHSDNPMDIHGEIHGKATFAPKPQHSTSNGPNQESDMVYQEEGEMPKTLGMGMAGLRWSKRYMWRLSGRRMSVWFVKTGDEEADYLFHEFDFNPMDKIDAPAEVTAPLPPMPSITGETTVLTARGSHLCINDMYRTAYAFRIRPETGQVLSWSSRHVVKGPKKDQDIVNIYQREG